MSLNFTWLHFSLYLQSILNRAIYIFIQSISTVLYVYIWYICVHVCVDASIAWMFSRMQMLLCSFSIKFTWYYKKKKKRQFITKFCYFMRKSAEMAISLFKKLRSWTQIYIYLSSSWINILSKRKFDCKLRIISSYLHHYK